MAKKYYAVAKGKTIGIYFNWEDCKAQVDNFPNARYKGFERIDEAADYIEKMSGGEDLSVDKNEIDGKALPADGNENGGESAGFDVDASLRGDADNLVAFVDGSYDDTQKRYAYGCVLVLQDGEVTLNGSDDDAEYVTMRNVAGEILGSEQAIAWAAQHGYKKITIYYDYEGIEKWANDVWKANKTGTIRYKEYVASMRGQIQIEFVKVAAHTGVKYNEMADKLAKQALGLVEE